MNKPEQRPEGRLLERLREKAGRLTVRGAAKRVTISEARWRQIEKGYSTPAKGQHVEVVAPADTLAEMVRALDGLPDDLIAAGRADAASSLEKLGDRGVVVSERLAGVSDVDLAVELARRLGATFADTESPEWRAKQRQFEDQAIADLSKQLQQPQGVTNDESTAAGVPEDPGADKKTGKPYPVDQAAYHGDEDRP